MLDTITSRNIVCPHCKGLIEEADIRKTLGIKAKYRMRSTRLTEAEKEQRIVDFFTHHKSIRKTSRSAMLCRIFSKKHASDADLRILMGYEGRAFTVTGKGKEYRSWTSLIYKKA